MTPDIRTVINLPADDTVRAFEARDDLRATVRWHEMWQEDHARAFTVAKIANLDLLETVRQSLHRVLRDGGTFEQWRASIEPELAKAGWLGVVTDRTLTGADHDIYVGTRRLRTIYDTNLRMSRAAGRWQRIQALKGARPFLRYTAVMDDRTRDQHRVWHGTILPVDHPWWDTHYPPCGWHCRCTVRQLSQRDLDRNGWKVSDVPPEGPPSLFQRAGSPSPVAVPARIDPGFGYHPGKAAMAPIADRLLRTTETLAQSDLETARRSLRTTLVPEVVEQVLKEPETAFPVLVLDDTQRAALDAPSRVVTFTYADLQNQIAKRGIPAAAIYRQIARLPEAADVITLRDGRLSLSIPGALRLTATVGVRDDGLHLTAFEWLSDRSLNQRIANAHILKDVPVQSAGDAARHLLSLPEGDTASVAIGRADGRSVEAVVGFQRRMAADVVQHVRKRHFVGGSAEDEHPLTIDDLALIDRVLAEGDMRFDGAGEAKEQVWVLEIGGLYHVYVERVGRRQGQLTMRTFYKSTSLPGIFRRGIQGPDAKAPDRSTSETPEPSPTKIGDKRLDRNP